MLNSPTLEEDHDDIADPRHRRSASPGEERLAGLVDDPVALCRQIVEQSGDCIKVLDAEARLLWMNVGGQRLMDICDVAPLVGQSWLDFWSGESREAAARAFAAARAGGVGRFTGPCPTMSGVVKWWNVVVTELPREAGGERLVCTSRDVTEIVEMVERQRELADAERAARAEAERARRSSDALLHNVSHDLRTPLNAMLGWSRLLRDEALSTSACRALDGIESAAARQIGMVEQLLDAARAGAESLRLELETMDLTDAAADVLTLLKPLMDAKRLSVQLASPAVATTVLADRAQLQRAISNLISNAVKFTPPNGTVRVEIAAGPSGAKLTVADSGAGLSARSLARVFDRFWSDGGAAEANEAGVGLGLAIVRSIVELHGGTVEAQSDGPGQGARFTISLPLARPPSRAPLTEPPLDGADLHGIHVLLVAPDTPARDALAGTLEHAGASIVTAAAEAAPSISRGDVHVVVLDAAAAADDLRGIAEHATAVSAAVLLLGPQEFDLGPSSADWMRMSKPVVARELAHRVRELAQASGPHTTGSKRLLHR